LSKPRTTPAPPTSTPDLGRATSELEALCRRLDAATSLNSSCAELLQCLTTATMATRASLMLVNPATGSLRIAAAFGLAADFVGHDVPSRPRSISDWVMRQRRGLILNGDIKDQRFTGVEGGRTIESAMSLPVMTAAGPIGVINLARNAPAPEFTDPELAAVGRMLEAVGATLARLQSLAQAEHIADLDGRHTSGTLFAAGAHETLHHAFGLSHVSGFRPHAAVVERVTHADGSHSLLVAEACGDDAALPRVAAFTQGLFVATASPERSAAGLVARLNLEIHQRHHGAIAMNLWASHFGKNGELTSSIAGNPAPFWIPSDGGETQRLGTGPRCGAEAQASFDQEHVRLHAGDVVVAVSDGVLNSPDGAGRRFGDRAVIELLETHRREPLDRLTAAITAAALEHAGRTTPAADLVVCAIRFQPSR
jgi:hypothetical protein